MYIKHKPDETVRGYIGQFLHCDSRILHAPGECQFCDRHPIWQALRLAWGIAFTGYLPKDKELPCPADNARGSTVHVWPGNQPQPATVHPGADERSE